MARQVILVRGVNVGGVVLRMEDFRATLASLGLSGIRTYIQSGNAVVEGGGKDSRAFEKRLASALAAAAGFDVTAIVRQEGEFRKIAAAHPLDDGSNAKGLYATLLAGKPDAEGSAVLAALAGEERFEVRGDTVYAFYGAGYGKSKFTNNYLEKRLGVAATTRNWATMSRLLGMLDE